MWRGRHGGNCKIERSLRVIFASTNHNEERRESMKLLKKNSKLLSKLGKSLLREGLKISEKSLRELYDTIYEKLSGKTLQTTEVETQ